MIDRSIQKTQNMIVTSERIDTIDNAGNIGKID